jgi:hypothetical protein
MRRFAQYVNLAMSLARSPPQGGITMAKNNKNRKQSGNQQDRATESERGAEENKSSAMDTQSMPQGLAQGSPSDVARKHQRRFGHN